MDTSLYSRTTVDFTPSLGHGPIAEITLGTMLGLAALTLLSLVYMALRVRWRGPFGRRSSVVLRAVYPLVLGLGGLFLGVLVVLATDAGLFVVDELVVSLSVGVPIGLGVYLAWVIATPPADGHGARGGSGRRPRRSVARFNVTDSRASASSPRSWRSSERPPVPTCSSSRSTSSGIGRDAGTPPRSPRASGWRLVPRPGESPPE